MKILLTFSEGIRGAALLHDAGELVAAQAHTLRARGMYEDTRRWIVRLSIMCAQGRYSYKLLAVDVPAAPNADQRLYLEGDDSVYNRGSVISELRDPFVNVRSCCSCWTKPHRGKCACSMLPCTHMVGIYSQDAAQMERSGMSGFCICAADSC